MNREIDTVERMGTRDEESRKSWNMKRKRMNNLQSYLADVITMSSIFGRYN